MVVTPNSKACLSVAFEHEWQVTSCPPFVRAKVGPADRPGLSVNVGCHTGVYRRINRCRSKCEVVAITLKGWGASDAVAVNDGAEAVPVADAVGVTTMWRRV